MHWKRVAGSPLILVAGIASFVFGLPGMFDDAEVWYRWIGNIGASWSAGLLGAGVAFVGVWLIAKLASLRVKFQHIPLREIAKLAGLLITLIAAIAFLIVIITTDRPSFVWVHPTLSLDDQEKAKAKCTMRAFDAIGGSGSISKGVARREYMSACLQSEGFALEQKESR